MNIREAAERWGVPPVGRLRRLPDVYYGMGQAHYPLWVDEAGNEYCLSNDGKELDCIITANGGVI